MSKLTRTIARRLVFSGAIVGGTTVAVSAGAALGLAAAYWGVKQAWRFDLKGRVVLITGGSRGLGLAMARQFLKRGARVALLARDPEELERAKQLLAGQGSVFVHACDVRNQSEAQNAVYEVQRELGDIDVLVNNAGTITVGPMDSMTADDYREALEISFWAPFYLASAVLPQMRRKRSGRIVNISSIGGKISVPHLLPYCTGKFAMAGWSEGLRAELAKENIRVTSVFPGLMRTGSPRNADFKGKHRAEYTWFLLSDATPGLSINADRAARQIVKACEYGRAELVVALPAKIAVKAHALFPGLSSIALRLSNQLMPEARDGSAEAKKGAQSATAITDSWLTALDERAANKNNQVSKPLTVTS